MNEMPKPIGGVIILCRFGLQDAQIADQTLFLDVSIKVFPEIPFELVD